VRLWIGSFGQSNVWYVGGAVESPVHAVSFGGGLDEAVSVVVMVLRGVVVVVMSGLMRFSAKESHGDWPRGSLRANIRMSQLRKCPRWVADRRERRESVQSDKQRKD
jgi:hypothetical protein